MEIAKRLLPAQAPSRAQRTSHPERRPLPLRMQSVSEASGPQLDTEMNTTHLRAKSTHTGTGIGRLKLGRTNGNNSYHRHIASEVDRQVRSEGDGLSGLSERSHDSNTYGPRQGPSVSIPTPPSTPSKPHSNVYDTDGSLEIGDIAYDFSQIDYELDRAATIGKGLWSVVYFAQPITKTPRHRNAVDPKSLFTPEPPTNAVKCSLYAIKVPARPDAMKVFNQEARMLTKLQQSRDASEHIVPFYGLDLRSSSLVFEGVVGGSLENLVSRLKVMTEWARHPEVVTLFPKLAYDMVRGLRFIHDAGVVHADIKPSNVLLDISGGINPSDFVIRARYIDFSAAFSVHDGSFLDSGGTWSFMAPEQLRRGDLNTPTFASDIWSVGVSLLYILVGASPYAYVCGDNVFRLREAIKAGDPIGFARMDDTVRQRLDASQDFVDCCRLALQKDPSRRATASAWLHWLGIHDTGY